MWSATGSLYEPSTLTSIQRSLDRHLTKDHHKPCSIIRDVEFSSSQQLLTASKKILKKVGKGNKSKASQPLENVEIEQLWISGALGSSSPEILQNTVWFLLCLHLGMMGCDEHYKLRYSDLEVKCSSEGTSTLNLVSGILRLALVKDPTLAHLNLKCGAHQKNQTTVPCYSEN